jgi:hypothetical protein
MSYTLATAAKATGLNKSTILRAIKSGQITGTKDQFGEWRVEPVELHRVYPAVAELSAGSDVPRPHATSDAAALEAEIESGGPGIYSDNSSMRCAAPATPISESGARGGGARRMLRRRVGCWRSRPCSTGPAFLALFWHELLSFRGLSTVWMK